MFNDIPKSLSFKTCPICGSNVFPREISVINNSFIEWGIFCEKCKLSFKNPLKYTDHLHQEPTDDFKKFVDGRINLEKDWNERV